MGRARKFIPEKTAHETNNVLANNERDVILIDTEMFFRP